MIPSKNQICNFKPILHFISETILTPLQASTVLFKVDQRRVALDPPLPPITRHQIHHGELSTLLVETDYDLSTMVGSKFYIIYFNNYLSVRLL